MELYRVPCASLPPFLPNPIPPPLPLSFPPPHAHTPRSTVTQTVEPAYKHSRLPAVVGDLRYKSRLCSGSLRAWASRRQDAWEQAFGPEEEPLPADDWSVCTLLERNKEGGGDVLRYRFGLQVRGGAELAIVSAICQPSSTLE